MLPASPPILPTRRVPSGLTWNGTLQLAMKSEKESPEPYTDSVPAYHSPCVKLMWLSANWVCPVFGTI